MDYEKKYNEALERARQIKDGKDEWRYSDLAEITPALTEIFPELRESEDERVRKELIQFLRDYPTNLPNGKYSRSDFFAYLEKQKENPQSADSIPADCVSDVKCGNSRHKVGDSLEGRKLADEVVVYLIKSGYQPIIKDTLDQKHFQIKIPRHKEDFFQSKEYKHCREILDEYYYEGDFAGDVYTLYVLRQKEQKPNIEICPHSIKSKSYKENGYPIEDCDYGLEIAFDILEKTFGEVRGYQTDDGIREHQTAIEAVRKAKEQKPAEWSEEDESMRKEVVSILELYRKEFSPSILGIDKQIGRMISWINSIHAPKRENWDDADAQTIGELKLIIWQISQIPDNRKKWYSLWLDRHCNAYPIPDNLLPKWKPSEEQMEALKKVTGNAVDADEYYPALATLYYDLKEQF